jgi:putative transposase
MAPPAMPRDLVAGQVPKGQLAPDDDRPYRRPIGALPRPRYEREFVHAYTRGNNRACVFFDEFDYVAWLRLLGVTIERFRWRCHAHCLMPNHYHLLLEVSREQLSAGMRHLNGSFAQRINARYDRTGHVFEGPYHEELVADDAYLLELCRYIPLNPVRARLCRRADDWPFSSYRATAGLEHPPPLLTVSFVRSLFGKGPTALERYRQFMAEGAMRCRDTSRDLVAGRGGFGR